MGSGVLVEALSAVEVDEAEWPNIVSLFADHSFENSLSYVRALAQKSRQRMLLVAVQSAGSVQGAAIVRCKTVPVLGYGVSYVSGGPLWRLKDRTSTQADAMAVLAAIQKYVVRQNGHILVSRFAVESTVHSPSLAEASCALGFSTTDLARTYRTILVDLIPDVTTLRSNLHSKWRNMLNQSDKSGLTIEVKSGSECWPRFLKLYAEMREAKEFDGGLGPEFFAGLEPDDAGLLFVFAKKEGEDAGGVVISALGDTAIYLFGATNSVGRDLRAGYQLQWQAMLTCRSRGFRIYDLGGIDEVTNPGGFQFKARMGGLIAQAEGPVLATPGGIKSALMTQTLRWRNWAITKKRAVANG
jgi:lipid II:glycine glycyltransferase (peptidoglycan interpeptide bridge formation enzyme)